MLIILEVDKMRCKHCKYWSRKAKTNYGNCDVDLWEETMYEIPVDKRSNKIIVIASIHDWDCIDVYMGENFGCVLFEEKDE